MGDVDGKHVRIIPPPNSGSFYFNYKQFHSLVLLVIANGSYEFIMCDFGINGRISDGGVIANTEFYHKLKASSLYLPNHRLMNEGGQTLNYVFIDIYDEAFSLRSGFLKSFTKEN